MTVFPFSSKYVHNRPEEISNDPLKNQTRSLSGDTLPASQLSLLSEVALAKSDFELVAPF